MWNLPCMRHGLSEVAHDRTAMGVLGPIHPVQRRRGEHPLVQDTVTGPLGSLHIVEVKHPLMHLDGLKVLHHLPQIWVDDVPEELVLGGA